MQIKMAVIDLSGTLFVEDVPTSGAVDALKRLRETGIQCKFVANKTKECLDALYNRMKFMGFELEINEIHTSLSAAVNYVKSNNLNPFYLINPEARKDFPEEKNKDYDSVLMGLAPNEFHYENFNKAFSILMEKKDSKLISIHHGKFYKRDDGLALGLGCFVKGLEYAASTNAILIGKPNKYFFETAVPAGIKYEECVMIGDDNNADCKASTESGMKCILVMTGKYMPDVVVDPPPTHVAKNFSEAVEWLLDNKDA